MFVIREFGTAMKKNIMKKTFTILSVFCSVYTFSQDTVKVAVALSPDQQAEADYNAGLEQMKKGDHTTAITFFTKSITAKPDFDKAYYNRAIALTHVKRYPEAHSDINRVIAKTPQNADYFFTKGLIYFNENKKDSLLQILDKCLGLKANHPEANYYKGMILYETGEYKQAIESYNKAIEADPKYVYAYNDRASAKRELRDFNGAISDYEKAITLDDKDDFIYNNLGSAYRDNKNYLKAIEAYDKALQVNPKYIIAQNNRGATWLEKGSTKNAQNDFEDVIKKDPTNSSAFNGLASVFIKEKEYKKATDMATKAILLNSKNGPAYYNRGIAKQMLRDDTGCCEDWRKALELGVTMAKAFIGVDCGHN